MKKTLHLIALFLAFAINGYCQDTYHPLLNTTSWYIYVMDMGGAGYYWLEPDGTETIGDYTYVKYPLGSTNFTYVREDVTAKKIYRYVDGADEVLYDFSLEVDDIITYPDNSVTTDNSYKVIEKSTINTLDGERTKLVIRRLDEMTGDETWIEGVGNINFDPLTPLYQRYTDPMFMVKCHYNNETVIYTTSIAGDCPVPPSLGTAAFATPAVTLYPNPFSLQATITTQGYFDNADLILYNSLGQEVKQMANINGKEIQLQKENLTPGIYHIRISQQGKTVLSEKVLITN